MSQEEHRAPARLAPVRPGWTAAPVANPRRMPQPPIEADIIDVEELAGRSSVPEPEPPRRSNITPPVQREREVPPPPPIEPESVVNERQGAESDSEMTTQEQYELLLHNIQLYDDMWKLAGIRANEKNNWLTAYLIPRNKQMDLKTAISKNLVLIITIDNRGNTDIKEPRKRGFIRHLTGWLYGE